MLGSSNRTIVRATAGRKGATVLGRAGAVVLTSLVCVLFAGPMIVNAGATAAPNTEHAASAVLAEISAAVSVPRTSTFCTLAQSASKTNTSSAATETPAAVLAAFNKLKSEEPTILSDSPSQLKGDFETIFTFFNGFYGQLSKVGYNFLKLPTTYLTSLEASDSKIVAAGKAIDAYLTKVCGLKSSS